ncbi:MAG TPA: glycoside hydrolase family 36 protein [Ktedonobacterales bacterium]|jgi:alpha-galactosidase|nr:glycoside hydrolase family 36 protein [Ktedonobacterales bacterium]
MTEDQAHSQIAESPLPFAEEVSETGPVTVISAHDFEVRWGHDAQLGLRARHAPDTAVAGGGLFELVDPARRKRWIIGCGLDRDPDDPLPFTDAHGVGLQFDRSFPLAVQPLVAECDLRLYENHSFVRLATRIRHMGEEPVCISRAFPFTTGAWWEVGSFQLGGRAEGWSVYKQGWQSWSYAGGLPSGARDPRPQLRTLQAWHSPGGRSPRTPFGVAAEVVSDEVALVGYPDEPTAFLVGFLNADEWLGQIVIDRRSGALAATVLLDDVVIAPGETLELPPLLLALGPQADLLTMYAEAVGREQHARRPAKTLSGWCSWYYYFTKPSQVAIEENLAALQQSQESVPLDVVQIDDGYQTAVGDWTSLNERFPDGMAHLAKRIRAAGYRPGLWLAPFTVAANSQLAHVHPDWLVRAPSGKPVFAGKNWGSELYGLDTSHPGAQEWLRDLFSTVTREWGFDYLKLDFLASGAVHGRRYDARVTRARALRDGLALIRKTVGDDAFILGCGCPLLGAVGLVDAMRIGPDTSPRWRPYHNGLPVPGPDGEVLPTTAGAIRNTLERVWMGSALWMNDPDCLLLRDHETHLSLDEIRAFATAVGVTGGMALVSDRMASLNPERLDMLARLLPPMRERAQPRSYFERGIPGWVTAHVKRPWGSWLLAGAFNANGRKQARALKWSELGLPEGRYHAVEFWSGAYLGQSESGVDLALPRHGAAALAIHRVSDEPQIVGSTFHIGQGAVELDDVHYDPQGEILSWSARLGRRARGSFIAWLPPQFRVHSVISDARAVEWKVGVSGEVIVSAEIHDAARFALEVAHER